MLWLPNDGSYQNQGLLQNRGRLHPRRIIVRTKHDIQTNPSGALGIGSKVPNYVLVVLKSEHVVHVLSPPKFLRVFDGLLSVIGNSNAMYGDRLSIPSKCISYPGAMPMEEDFVLMFSCGLTGSAVLISPSWYQAWTSLELEMANDKRNARLSSRKFRYLMVEPSIGFPPNGVKLTSMLCSSPICFWA